MKGYSDIQAELAATKTKYTTYANHILNHISVFVQGMVNDLVQTLKDRNNFNGLDESLKKYESWKIRKNKESIPAVGATAAPVGDDK
jgi:hypothetical protein